ncbi:LuxR C-terminal-related transcriptional regulator [Streptomyces sp. NPDC001107]
MAEPDAAIAQLRELGRQMTSVHPDSFRAEHPPAPLTDREREVLLLLATGERNQWFARRLDITEPTVRAHTAGPGALRLRCRGPRAPTSPGPCR